MRRTSLAYPSACSATRRVAHVSLVKDERSRLTAFQAERLRDEVLAEVAHRHVVLAIPRLPLDSVG